MPCPHNEITIVQRSQRQSAVAAAAYQSGEKLFCEYDQQVKHYPEKRGNAQPEQYQTFVFDGNTYKSIGPFDTEEELFNALKDYTDAEVEAGTMTQTEATALLEKYQ